MNGYGILNESARLIGMDFADEKLKTIGLTLLNSALSDMGIRGISSLSATPRFKSQSEGEAVKFLLSALIANAVGDSLQAENMSQIYNTKKGELKACIGRIKDTLPRGEY